MEYIFIKSYTGKVIFGDTIIRKGTKAQITGMLMYVEDKPIASTHSDFAYTYTVRNDDGKGLMRAALIREIKYQKALRFNPAELTTDNFPNKKFTYVPNPMQIGQGCYIDENQNAFFDRLAESGYIRKVVEKSKSGCSIRYEPKDFIAYFGNDGFMAKFRRQEHTGVWLWNHDFYNADIGDLEKILNKIKGV